MSVWNDRFKGIIHRGNKPLTVGIIWSVFGIMICPCPVCLIGSMSFLIFGIADKFGFARYINVKTKKHERCNCKDDNNNLDIHQISK